MARDMEVSGERLEEREPLTVHGERQERLKRAAPWSEWEGGREGGGRNLKRTKERKQGGGGLERVVGESPENEADSREREGESAAAVVAVDSLRVRLFRFEGCGRVEEQQT